MKKAFLFIAVLFTSLSTWAFNCKDLYVKGYPDERFPAGLECSLAKKVEVDGVTVSVYHYTKGFPISPDDTGFAYRAMQVYADVHNTLMFINGDLYPKLSFDGLTFIFTDHPPEGIEVAKVRIGHYQDGEQCPVIVYASAFRKKSPDEQKQMLAHEIFHCIQDKLWLDKKLGMGKLDDWWSEGTAVWFSNLVYPSNNQEFAYNDFYNGDESLVEQSAWPYSAYLFFQSLSQSWLGVQGVLDLIKDIPGSGTYKDQEMAVINRPSSELIFHTFAEELTSFRIKDFDGNYMKTTMASEPTQEEVTEGEQLIDWTLDPLKIQITELKLPAHSIVYVENVSESYKNPISVRANSSGLWDILMPNYPMSVDTTCKKGPRWINLLSSYAGKNDSGVPENFQVKVKARKAECKCIEKELFDPCLYGTYEIDPKSIDNMFKRIFQDKKFTVEKSSGRNDLTISGAQGFKFDQTNFTSSVILHDDQLGDIRASVTMNGTTDALGKHPNKGELCFSDLGDEYSIKIRVEFPQGVAESEQPYSQFEDLTAGDPLKYTCSSAELILLRPLPTGPDGSLEYLPIRFKRVTR